MLIIKAIQIRDEATNIPALAWRFKDVMTTREHAIIWRAGFSAPSEYVMLTKLVDMESQYDPFKWPGGARTMKIAHLLLQGQLDEAARENLGIVPDTIELYSFDRLESGDVLDVGHALGFNERKQFEPSPPIKF